MDFGEQQDLRYGMRMLRRSPGFTAVAVLTLALGIGATSSIFSVVKAVILNPLPFRQPGNLVHLWQSDRVERYHRGDQPYFSTVSPGMFYEWRAQSQNFNSISAYRWRAMLAGGGKEAELLNGQEVVDNFFETLGVPAQLGRTFQAADYAPDAPHTTILSYLCLPKMLSGANAFEISDLQEAENGGIASQEIRMKQCYIASETAGRNFCATQVN